jgi:hypothetical protein
MINKDIRPKLNSDILWRRDGADDELVVLASCNGGPIRFLNPVGAMIIKLSNGKNTFEDIVEVIESSFEVADKKTIENDVYLFLNSLKENKILKF